MGIVESRPVVVLHIFIILQHRRSDFQNMLIAQDISVENILRAERIKKRKEL